MFVRQVVNSMPMLKRNPLRLHKLHFKGSHFNIVFFKKACLFRDVLVIAESLISRLRLWNFPAGVSFFLCKDTADRKNVKCHWRFRSEGLPAAFRKFSRSFKIWVFRPHSQTSHLPYLPFCPQWQSRTKKGSPGQEAQKASTKGKIKKQFKNDYGKHGNKFRRKKGNGQCFTA